METSKNVAAVVPFTDEQAAGDSLILKSISETVDLKAALSLVKRGRWVMKVTITWWGHVRRRPVYAYVDMESLKLCWSNEKSRKDPKNKFIAFRDVDKIVPAEESKNWKRFKEKERKLGFDLVSALRSRRFVVANTQEWKLWLRGLLYAQTKAVVKRKRIGLLEDAVLKDLWLQADVDHSGSMQLDECITFLRSIGVHADIRYITSLFASLSEDESNALEFDEFQKFMMQLIAQEDLLVIFSRYQSDPASPVLTEANFVAFLTDVQRAKQAEIDTALISIRKMKEPFRITRDVALKEHYGGLTVYGFSSFIMSSDNSIINPSKLKMNRSMNAPMTDYWIRSASYPLDGPDFYQSEQKEKKRKLHQLKHALSIGYRCFLFDCYQINNNVFIKRLRRRGVPLFMVLRCLRDHAFSNNNEYPVFLILDIGDCIPMLIDENINRILGNAVYVQKHGEPLPSPETVLCRFIILEKVSKRNAMALSVVSKKVRKEQILLDKVFWGEPCDLTEDFVSRNSEPSSSSDSIEYKPSEEDLVMRRHIVHQVKTNISSTSSAPTLVVGTYKGRIINRRRLSNALTKGQKSLFMVDQTELRRLTRDVRAPQQLIELTQSNLCLLTFTEGPLVATGNDPYEAWTRGIQFVPIQLPVKGLGSLMESSLFSQEEGCGYVLKPNILKGNSTELRRTLEQPVDLYITILAARQIPYPYDSFGNEISEDSISPSILVTVKGTEITYHTPVLLNKGLNPRWQDQKFKFEIMNPSLSFVVFEVHHFDPMRTITVGWAAFPMTCIRQGLRWVPLENVAGETIAWSGILVDISYRPARRKSDLPDGTGLVPRSVKKNRSK